MIRRIELTNFMSHRHTVIEPAPGLTVLVGPNNCGKSAVVTALRLLCHNENSKFVMRHGEKECSICVETDDGHVVEWHRKDSPRYVIDGQTFDRLGIGGVPEELHRILRLPPVEASSETFDVHFGEQKSPIFLIDKSGSNAAAFFASSSDVIRLVEMQNLHRKRMNEKRDDRKRLEARSKRINDELEALQPMTELDRQLALLESLHGELTRLAVTIEQADVHTAAWAAQAAAVERHRREAVLLAELSPPPALVSTAPLAKLTDDVKTAERMAAKLQSRQGCLSQLPPLPEILPTAPLAEHIHALQRAEVRLENTRAVRDALEPLGSPPAMADAAGLNALLHDLRQFQDAAHRRQREQQATASLPGVPVFESTESLARLVRNLRAAEKAVAITEKKAAAFSRTLPVPGQADVLPLVDLLVRIERAEDNVLQCEAKCQSSETALEDAERKVRDWAAWHPVCPTCGGAVDADLLVMGGHGHE